LRADLRKQMIMSAMRVPFSALVLFAAMTMAAFATEANYECNGGTRLTATFQPLNRSLGSVLLVFAGSGDAAVLPQALSADGGRYAKGDTEFWIKGNSATLTRRGKRET